MTENKKPLIILTGPTAVGKTSASIGDNQCRFYAGL